MTNQQKEARRVSLRTVFNENKFKLTQKKEKSDEFKHESGEFLYFFWPQGAEPNIAIDPRIEYAALLKLNGVNLGSKKGTLGLRAGTSMSAFPKKYESFIPDNPLSYVGRMFVVQQDILPIFLRTLSSLLVTPYQNPAEKKITAPPTTDNSLHEQSTGIFSDEDLESASKIEHPIEDTQLRAIKTRRGQPDFRKRLLEAYGNRCAVTGCEVLSVLEAAHINPHANGTDWETDNGLPLRADIHTLFDLRLLSLTPDCCIQISDQLSGSAYEEFHGKMIHLPLNRDHYPAPAKLAKHYEGFNLRYSK